MPKKTYWTCGFSSDTVTWISGTIRPGFSIDFTGDSIKSFCGDFVGARTAVALFFVAR